MDLTCSWICSGTPTPTTSLDDELTHIFGLLRFLGPGASLNWKAWTRQIAKPIASAEDSGRERLQELLGRVTVRTPVDVMNRDVRLPPLTVKVVSLDLEPWQLAVYNQHILLIRANLLLSRFEGPDSFLHPNNRKFAAEALRNLRESCLFKAPLDPEKLVSPELELYRDLSGEKVKTPELTPAQRREMEMLYDRVRFYQKVQEPCFFFFLSLAKEEPSEPHREQTTRQAELTCRLGRCHVAGRGSWPTCGSACER